ncbi:hypothetical protein CDL15_Pgr026103 [Punica granatum]|uniref:Uncharacterized protein n=1 Tax=Punica granatum TaxID=22663 RepID=A0A218WCJ9_PUNGR|nr:hypothetical protein CDL15_Pgr026103 [Punica granatum]PKI34868.1 hypothetical protein CRG98_044714 [Punica granatum]
MKSQPNRATTRPETFGLSSAPEFVERPEDLEDVPGLLVDETADAFDAALPGEAADGWLGNSLDVVTLDLPVMAGAARPQPLASR